MRELAGLGITRREAVAMCLLLSVVAMVVTLLALPPNLWTVDG